ncbi:MAG: [FeFe] hydrogenase H-cluster radical SAM maturase HydE [Candidatus Aegiribacteria sp.]|nr:[FeFe] hydrogenase H-cluster radical SAM maturase HydE [Candidatus Aegiribacteria sp.]
MNLSGNLSRESIIRFLEGRGSDSELFEAARGTLLKSAGSGVFLRGIIELSNSCRKNCFYCGLRRDNKTFSRYTIPFDEVICVFESGYAKGLRSFLLQSGELLGDEHIDHVERLLRWVSRNLEGVRMVLSMGELPIGILERLRKAGAHRYLLRIEASTQELYERFHPGDGLHEYDDRLRSLQTIRESGWQTGTGVLIGLPGQTAENLADDLLFMKEMDIDMCGMGPYLEHDKTPLWNRRSELSQWEEREILTLRMISLLRILLPTINIAATTALQTLDPEGLEKGLMAGANVVMPNLTPIKYRKDYNLYQGKVHVEDTLDEVLKILENRCGEIGRDVKLGSPGDPLHFTNRMKEQAGGWTE